LGVTRIIASAWRSERRTRGYEVVVAEGFAHVDVLTAEDTVDNPIPAALVAFLARNAL